MKIYVRHGNYEKAQEIKGNFFSILTERGMQQIVDTRENIKRACEERGEKIPYIAYCSYEDRAIETAMILLDGNAARVNRCRDEMFGKLDRQNLTGIKKQQMYMAVGPREFDGVRMTEDLERYVPDDISGMHKDIFVVVHEPSAESIGLKLGEGQFEIVDD